MSSSTNLIRDFWLWTYNSLSFLPLVILIGVEFVNHLVHHDDKIHVDSFEYASSFEVPINIHVQLRVQYSIYNLFQYDIAFYWKDCHYNFVYDVTDWLTPF